MNNIYEIRRLNLVTAIEEKAHSRQSVASDMTGISPSQLSQYVTRNKNLGSKTARKIEAALGYPENWMDIYQPPDDVDVVTLENSWQLQRPEPRTDAGRTENVKGVVKLPLMNARASMGNGSSPPDNDDVIKTMVTDESWLSRNVSCSAVSNLALLTGFGDSMIPTFAHGDILLVDRGVTEVKIDAVYVLMLNNELYIKRIQRRPDGTFLMISDNPSYPPYVIQAEEKDRFSVLARVVLVWNAKRL